MLKSLEGELAVLVLSVVPAMEIVVAREQRSMLVNVMVTQV